MLRTLSLLLALTILTGTPAAANPAKEAFRQAERRNWQEALLSAKRIDDEIILKLITWQYLLDPDSGAGFSEIRQFIDANHGWPGLKRLRVRAEAALNQGATGDEDIIAWFEGSIPLTGMGKLWLAEAYERTSQSNEASITQLIRDAWKDGDFEEPHEKQILLTHKKRLRPEDHIARVDRLLWEDKITPAKRILHLVPQGHRRLFEARIALIDDKRHLDKFLAQVPASLKKDPGLIYNRMRWRERRGLDKGVREMLLLAPKTVPYPHKWWRTREMHIREAIDEGNYSLAKKLLANHGQVDSAELADAIWLDGWIKCEFTKEPKAAYDAFTTMFNNVSYAVSRARAAFWAGRAAEKSGEETAAKNWYNTASAYPTTFYGQLAALKVHGRAPLHIPAPPVIRSGERRDFEDSDLVRAVKIAADLDMPDLASLLVSHMVENAGSDSQAMLAAELGKSIGHPFLSVRGAKKAMQKNIILIDAGYPVTKLEYAWPIERPLALAITRQESEFDPQAKSPSNARGMMQLLPSTAKEVARKNGMKYSLERLYDEEYNMQLGSDYLSRMIDGFDGSYIMAIAAYNAGPGNVRKWIKSFGTPGGKINDAINWIEKIPFAETRNYVQRVLENLQVYRHIEAGDNAPVLKLGDDLVR